MTLSKLNETSQEIFDHYSDLLRDILTIEDETPEASETLASLRGELRGIKFVVDLLSSTSVL